MEDASPQFHIRRADWNTPSDRELLQCVRREVFIVEQQVPEALEWDDDDTSAIHLLAVAQGTGEPVGTARILSSGQIGRMAVLRPWRGKGIGTALLKEAVLHSAKAPFLHAQVHALPFYQRFGFEPRGETFDEAGIPHQLMTKSAGT